MKKETSLGCCATDHDHHSSVLSSTVELPVLSGQVKSRFYIEAMDCPVEEELIRNTLQKDSSITALQFNLLQRQLTVVHDESALSALQAKLKAIGMTPKRLTDEQAAAVPSALGLKSLVRIGAAVIIALGAEIASWLAYPEWSVLGLALMAIALSGLSVYKKGLVALWHRQISINALMSIAVTGAIFLRQWPEAAMVMSLFALAELLEAYSLDKASRAVDALLQLAPNKVQVQTEKGQWQWQSARDVAVNRIVKVMPGERVGLDGVVVQGQSDVNQAPITGESMPVIKRVGDALYAGSINGLAELQLRTTGNYDQSLLSQIAQSVQQAQQSKAPVQRFVDRFAQIYTPLVLVLALAVAIVGPLMMGGLWQDWIYKALVLLVIACPCALVISTPVAVVSALATAARAGLLIKGGAYLERARHINYVALDKTGTLTQGKPQLQDIWISDAEDKEWTTAVAYALASRSDHPASIALAQSLQSQVHGLDIQAFNAVAGSGVQAYLERKAYQLGRYKWVTAAKMTSELAAWQQQWLQRGASFVYLSREQQVIAAFAVADQLKPGVAQAIEELNNLQVQVEVLSGDNQQAVDFVAKQANISNAAGDLMPADKLKLIQQRSKQFTHTAMVGDGINDAPALAQADISFAMGALGSDMAIETADIAIMNDDLQAVAYTIRLSRRLHRVLVQNISAALGIKAVFLLLAVTGHATMWMAVFADVGASLLVVINSLRLLQKTYRS